MWHIQFDHAAVATRDPEKLKYVLKVMGLKDIGSEDVASQGVRTHFLQPETSQPNVEILEVLDPQGVVAKFLDKKGPGIHHLSFIVDQLEPLTEALKKAQIRLVYDKARPGAHHTLVNFIHPESTGGILIEISQRVAA